MRHGERRRVVLLDRLLAFLRPLPAVWGEAAAMWTRRDVQCWLPMLRSKGILTQGAKAAVKALGKDQPEGFMGETVTLDEMESWITPGSFGPLMAGDVGWLAAHAATNAREHLAYPLAVMRRFGGKALREAPKLVIGTIHSSKGGEAAEVWIFPDLSPSGMEEEETGTTGRDAVTRMFYVGFTRARERLVLCPPATRFHVTWE